MIKETKVCSKCGIEKPISEFKKSKERYRCECKICQKEYQSNYMKKYQKEHREQSRLRQKKYYENHKKEIYERNKEKRKLYREKNANKIREKREKYLKRYNEENKEKIKQKRHEYYEKNKECIKNKVKQYRENNIDKVKEMKQNYYKKNKELIVQKYYKKRKQDKIYNLKCQIRSIISFSFSKKGYVKNQKLKEIVGLGIDEFVEYLLQTFKNNYGYEWDKKEPVHIDHIIPLATAKTEEEVIKLCHYTNLQLLKAKDNMKKHTKLDWRLEDVK